MCDVVKCVRWHAVAGSIRDVVKCVRQHAVTGSMCEVVKCVRWHAVAGSMCDVAIAFCYYVQYGECVATIASYARRNAFLRRTTT